MEGMAAELAHAETAVQKVFSLEETNQATKATEDEAAAEVTKTAEATDVAEDQEMNDSAESTAGPSPDWDKVFKTEAVQASAPHGVTLVLLLGNPPILGKLMETRKNHEK